MGRFREAKFVVAVVLAVVGLADAATGEGFSIPALRDNKAAVDSYWSYRLWDVARPRFSGYPAQTFDRIAIDVRGPYWGQIVDGDPAKAEMAARIDEYARRVLQSRLRELGLARIQVSFFESMYLFSQPKEVRDCATLVIDIHFYLVEQTLQGQQIVALVGDSMASQQPMEGVPGTGTRHCSDSAPPWVLHDGPRVSLTAGHEDAAIEQEVRAQILRMVDFSIVPQIADTHDEAKARLRSWGGPGK
jgi:hypothetical protein